MTGLWTSGLRYLFEDFALDTDRRELRRDGRLIRLAPQVFDLLHYLIDNRGRVVPKDDLIGGVWGGRIVSDSALVTRINAVRTAIGDSGEQQRLIKTLPRKGIRFIGVVREQRPVVANAIDKFVKAMGGIAREKILLEAIAELETQITELEQLNAESDQDDDTARDALIAQGQAAIANKQAKIDTIRASRADTLALWVGWALGPIST